MPDIYPPFVIGDRVETWGTTNHGRADGPSTFGVVVTLTPRITLRTDDGQVVGTEDCVRVITPAPRPRFTITDRIDTVREALSVYRSAKQAKKLVDEAHDQAHLKLRQMRMDVKANGDGACPHPADLTENDVCQVCGLMFDDGVW